MANHNCWGFTFYMKALAFWDNFSLRCSACTAAVSYTHLDVYKRQTYINAYTCNEYTVRAMVEKLMGRSDFKGTSPVDPFAGLWDTKL